MKLKLIKNIVGFITIFNSASILFAQQINDFYFKQAQPRKEEQIGQIPKSIRGLYKSEKDTIRRLRISADSISVEIPMVMYASREELIAKNYTVTDSLLITSEGKELLCMAKNDTLFFVDYVQSPIFVLSNSNSIKKNENIYILSLQQANSYYTCMLLIDDGNKITIAQFDADKKLDEINKNKKIEKITNTDVPYYLADLKLKDFLKIVNNNYFPIKQVYYKRYSQL